MASGEHTHEHVTVKGNVSTSEMVNILSTQVNPGQFAQKLNEVGLVSLYVVQKASAHHVLPSDRVRDVIQAVQATIQLDSSKYEDFIKVLRDEYPPLADKLTHGNLPV